jgi:hypothetical protein
LEFSAAALDNVNIMEWAKITGAGRFGGDKGQRGK